MIRLLSRNNRSVCSQHEMDARVGNQVGLELRNIHIQGPVEPQRSRKGRDNLRDQPVQVGVAGPLDVQVPAADVVQSLVVKAEGAVRVLQEGVRGEDAVVRLNDGRRHLGRRGDGETQLGLASVVDRKPLKKETSKTRSGSSSGGVEDEETLEPGAVVRQLSDAVEDEVNDLLPDGVVPPGVVVGGILLSGDDLLGVVELPVGSGADLVTDGGLQVHVDRAGDVLAGAGLREERVERVVRLAEGRLSADLPVRLDAVLEAVKLPEDVSGLDTDTFLGCVGGDLNPKRIYTDTYCGVLVCRLPENESVVVGAKCED